MPKKILTSTQDLEVIKLYEQGLTIDKIAESFNVGESTIGKVLRKHDIKTRKNTDYNNWKILSEKDEKDIIKLYQKNME